MLCGKVPPSCWLEMLLRDEARSQACILNGNTGANAEASAAGRTSADTGEASADVEGATAVERQPLSLVETAVAPCIEFAAFEEGGATEEESGQGASKNDDPGLLTAQPHAVSNEARDEIWPMLEISGSPQHCVGTRGQATRKEE